MPAGLKLLAHAIKIWFTTRLKFLLANVCESEILKKLGTCKSGASYFTGFHALYNLHTLFGLFLFLSYTLTR